MTKIDKTGGKVGDGESRFALKWLDHIQSTLLVDGELHGEDYQAIETIRAALSSTAQQGWHSKIDMDIEDAIGREITFEESQLIGLAIQGALNPEKPQWWKDIEWLAELRKPAPRVPDAEGGV